MSTPKPQENEARDSLADLEVMVGDVLADKYRVTKVLGKGGMGVVVEAVHVDLDEKVALKFLNPAVMHTDEAATERFLREAKAAVKLKSEHVARVRDVGTLSSGSPFIVMEYLKGCDLGELLDEQGPISYKDAVLYVVQACEALAHAHAIGLIHRDLKPPNLFLTKRADSSPCVKVLDFGISKFLSGSTSAGTSLTKTNTIIGSPRYLAPELWESARHASVATDIWALGAILYELISGRPAHEGESLATICRSIQMDQPPLLSMIAEIPDGLARVVHRALAKTPEARYQNVAELANALHPHGRSAAEALAHRTVRILEAAGKLNGTVPIPATSIPPAPLPRKPTEREQLASQETVIAESSPGDEPISEAKDAPTPDAPTRRVDTPAPAPAQPADDSPPAASKKKVAAVGILFGGAATIAIALSLSEPTTRVAPEPSSAPTTTSTTASTTSAAAPSSSVTSQEPAASATSSATAKPATSASAAPTPKPTASARVAPAPRPRPVPTPVPVAPRPTPVPDDVFADP